MGCRSRSRPRFLCLLYLLCGATGAVAQTAPRIPLVQGLTIVSALHYPEGDRENVVRVSNVTSAGASYTWRFSHPHGTQGSSLPDSGEFHRFVRASDLAGAPRVDQVFLSDGPEESPGFTAFSLSQGLFQRVRTQSSVPFSVTSVQGVSGLGASLGQFAGMFTSRFTLRGTLELASPRPEPMSVLLNGARVAIPTIHLVGRFTYEGRATATELWVVADSAHPLILKVVNGTDVLQTVRIDLPSEPSVLEHTLETTCRIELPGIYFAFNSAALDPASDPSLSAVAAMLARHAAWTVAIEGHTDSIGNADANQTLSAHRAEAVRTALTDRHHVAASRLSATGFGATRPREPNETLEGRARNRRVELVRRPCASAS